MYAILELVSGGTKAFVTVADASTAIPMVLCRVIMSYILSIYNELLW